MASRNADSVIPSQGEIHASKPRSEPLTTHGHAPGVMVGNDKIPTFEAQTLPPGTAPKERTFDPNPSNNMAEGANNPSNEPVGGHTAASATLTGATSAQVHTGLGLPDGDADTKGGRKQKAGLVGAEGREADQFK